MSEVQNKNEEKLLLSHEYDGIREFDNPMPKWWKWIFWGSFYFALGYFAHYHLTGNGTSVHESYELEIAAAREAEAQELLKGGGPSEQTLGEMEANAGLMTDAKTLFVQKCAQCHGNNGEGKIGPNLTDEYWIHGDGSLMAIYNVVSEGVPAKGMPTWSRQMRLIEVMKMAAFVGTIRNTNLPGPRPPEGNKVAAGPAGGAPTAAGTNTAPSPTGTVAPLTTGTTSSPPPEPARTTTP
jgi:cytochrome c oxidase cbb3-type subunit 3